MEFGKVVGRFLEIVNDSAGDSDELPDIVPLTGVVTFAPLTASFLVQEAGATSAIALNGPITAELDDAGEFSVWLPVGSYNTTFNLDGKRIAPLIVPVSTEHTAEAPLSLAEVILPPEVEVEPPVDDNGNPDGTEQPPDDGSGETDPDPSTGA